MNAKESLLGLAVIMLTQAGVWFSQVKLDGTWGPIINISLCLLVAVAAVALLFVRGKYFKVPPENGNNGAPKPQ